MSRASHPQLIAHRGASRERMENTLPAFRRALELGADGIELDVHGTIDGVMVVHHDPIPRGGTTSAATEGRPIDALTAEEVRRIVLPGDLRIPTLADVLTTVDGRAAAYVELKGRGIEAAVVDVIRASPAPDRCAVHSFDHESVRRARALAPELRGGILFDRPLADIASAMRAADALDVWPEYTLIDGALVNEVHAAGGRVIAWTVNDGARAARLAFLGVDALCTDTVPTIREAVGA